MLDRGFNDLEALNLNDLINIPDSLPTISADAVRVPIKLSKKTFIKRKNDKIDLYVNLPSYITKDIKSGDKIGSLTVESGNRKEEIDIIATCDIKIKKNTRRFF